MDSPALHQFILTLFNQIFFEIPQFVEFIPRLNAPLSPTVCNSTHSAQSVNLFFNEDGAPQCERCFLETSCGWLDWQLTFVIQVSTRLSPLLSSVRILNIERITVLRLSCQRGKKTWTRLTAEALPAIQVRKAGFCLRCRASCAPRRTVNCREVD